MTYVPDKVNPRAYNQLGNPLMGEDEFAFEEESTVDVYGNPVYGSIGSIAQSAAEESLDPSVLDMRTSGSYYRSLARKEELAEASAERNAWQLANTVSSLIPKNLRRRDDRALETFKAFKEGGVKELAGYEGMANVEMNPARVEQTPMERFLRPATTEQYYTPAKPGVYNRAGELVAESEVGYGKKGIFKDTKPGKFGGTKFDKPFEGKLSNIEFNPETGLYEKKFSRGKAAGALMSLASAAHSGGYLGGPKEDMIHKKGGKQHTVKDWANTLAPLLALTPGGWAAAGTLQSGIAAYDALFGDSKFDKKARSLKWDDIATGKNWKRIFGG